MFIVINYNPLKKGCLIPKLQFASLCIKFMFCSLSYSNNSKILIIYDVFLVFIYLVETSESEVFFKNLSEVIEALYFSALF